MIQLNVDIQDLNSFGLPCKVAGYCQVGSIEALDKACHDPKFQNKPRLILGGGSNLLLATDFPGLVIQPAWSGIKIIEHDIDSVTIKIGAAEPWHKLVTWSVDNHYFGLENLASIPGWCGAAPMQNIGAYGAELSDACLAVGYINLDTLVQHTLAAKECLFGYRTSIFKTQPAQNWLITDITLRLLRDGELKLDYPGVTEMLDQQKVQQPSPAQVAAAITRIRQHKLPDPAMLGNAGSFFKNPVISGDTANALLAQYPELPHWPIDDQVKLSAAWLIEQCGWKGRRQGAVGVHQNHALVLVHYGNGNGQQLLQLAGNIQQDVNQRFGIDLQPEPKVIQV